MALILARKIGEAIIIETAAGPVRVTRLPHGKLRVEAPKEIGIRREEHAPLAKHK
jgi:sRNA-binding carbon storage regulator CsrA